MALGNFRFLVSSLSDRRGHAVGIVFALLLASFLLKCLAQFWDPANQLAGLSVMNYYRPAEILRTGRLPLGDLATLLTAGLAALGLRCRNPGPPQPLCGLDFRQLGAAVSPPSRTEVNRIRT